MLLICPSCRTSYRIESAALGPQGRSVRCTRCHTEWFQTAETPQDAGQGWPGGRGPATEAEVAAFDHALGEAAGVATAEPTVHSDHMDDLRHALAQPADHEQPQPDLALPFAEAPSLAPHDAIDVERDEDPHADIESVAARRRSRRRTRAPLVRGPLPALVAALSVIVGGLLIGRETVVAHTPQMASLYAAIGLPVNLRGLTFEDVTISHGSHDGVPLLSVAGRIVNLRGGKTEVPRLRFAVRDKTGGEIYSWTAQPPQSALEAGASLPFRSRLAAPPEGAHAVVVRFFHQRDALAQTP